MKQTPLLLGALFVLATMPVTSRAEPPVTTATLESSEVRITYGELKRLLALREPIKAEPPVNEPPVAAALLSSQWSLDLAEESPQLTFEARVENLSGKWQLIPISPAQYAASQCDSPNARLVVEGENLCLITDKAGESAVKLSTPVHPGETMKLGYLPSGTASLRLTHLPKSMQLRVQQGDTQRVLRSDGVVALACKGGEFTALLEAQNSEPPAPSVGNVVNPAIIAAADYQTQIAPDGSSYTEAMLDIQHDQTAQMRLSLPTGARLLTCLCNNQTCTPIITDDVVQLSLSSASKGSATSKLSFSYTLALSELKTDEGELALSLPQTPWFIKDITWRVTMPTQYKLSAIGNITETSTDAAKPGLITIKKALCHDVRPAATLTYRRQ